VFWIRRTTTYDVHGPVSENLADIISMTRHMANNMSQRPFTDFPYVQLRLISATFGALQVPIAYITLKLMGQKSLTGLVAAALLIFENGAISQHRHILTTAPLGFFAATSIMMWVNFHNHQNK
jgi:dolichyl-phosphate-mannose-protein mannosyltransferase